MTGGQPLLSICTPTFERPELLGRALSSVVDHAASRAAEVEIIVSDNSTTDEPERVARQLLERWPGPTRYVRNRPSVSMVENHNRCLGLAAGRHVLFLQDDDHLLPGAVPAILDVLDRPDVPPVHLFGVHVVTADGRVRRRQVPRRDRVMDPATAMRCLLTHSSFVRLPGVVVRADAYAAAGPFDPAAGGAIDFDMWIRLFARYGLHVVPVPTAAYTVHGAALTTAMFNPDTVATLMSIFDRAAEQGVLDRRTIRRCEATWFHQFILAGAFRRLEARDRAGAAEVMRLFSLPAVRRLGPSARWLPARLAFSLLVLGARPRR